MEFEQDQAEWQTRVRKNKAAPAPETQNKDTHTDTWEVLREHQQLQVEFARVVARAEQHEQQTNALFALSQSVSVAHELDDLRQSIVESLFDALRADTASLFVREDDEHLRMVAQRNIDITRARIIFGPDEGIIALAMREQRVVHVPDTASHSAYLATEHDRPRSLLAIPVLAENGPSYVLSIVRRRVYAFTDDEVQFASLMGSVAAHALANAALYRQMQNLAGERAILFEIAHSITFSDSVLSFVGRSIDPMRRALGATGCVALFVHNGSYSTATDMSSSSSNEQIASHLISAQGMAQCVAFARELAERPTSAKIAIRCNTEPDGNRLVMASVVVRNEPVAVIGWENASAFVASESLETWGSALDQTGVEEEHPDPAFKARNIPPVPLSEAETTFIASVTQQLALGIENLRLRARDLSALRSISALPASRLHLDALRRDIVREVAAAFAPAAVALLQRDESEGIPRVMAITGGSGSSWAQAAVDLASHAAGHELLQRRGVALASLEADNEPIGWLVLRQSGSARLSADRAILFTSLASAAALLLRNARLHLMAREVAVDHERHRIAREIHDGVAQNLAHLMLRLELIQRLIPSDVAHAEAEAAAAREVLLTSLNDLRQSIAALAPAQIEALGFVGAVQALLDDISTNTPGLVVTFKSSDEAVIPEELRAQAFRIVQEGLTNIRKHAHAHHAWVEVSVSGGERLTITIADDGRGFTPDLNAIPGGHFGLRGMHERVDEFGGTLTITSRQGEGTTIAASFPLSMAA